MKPAKPMTMKQLSKKLAKRMEPDSKIARDLTEGLAFKVITALLEWELEDATNHMSDSTRGPFYSLDEKLSRMQGC